MTLFSMLSVIKEPVFEGDLQIAGGEKLTRGAPTRRLPRLQVPTLSGPCSPPALLSLPGFHPAQGCRNQCTQAEDEGDAGSTISLGRREGSIKCREAGSSLPGPGAGCNGPCWKATLLSFGVLPCTPSLARTRG